MPPKTSSVGDPQPVASSDVILLVEDNEDDAALVRRAFEKANVANPVHHARDAEEARQFLLDLRAEKYPHPLPVFILLDIGMPGMNGLEFLRWLRSQPVLRRIPVVMLTVSEEQSVINDAYDAGANSYLLKPGSRESVHEVLDKIREYWLTFNTNPAILLRDEPKAR